MNIDKSKAYKKLVKDMLKQYPKYDFDNPQNNTETLYAPYVDEDTLCQEINILTYCQGLGYADKTPKIKYLFVGQEFGFLMKHEMNFINKIKMINSGHKSMPYIDDEFLQTSHTTKNLIPLFEKLGYDITQRNSDLFFTNFCLGYRRDRDVKTTKELMMKDAPLFKELYNILEPANIITMGMRTFECVYETLTGEPYQEIQKFDDFIELVGTHKKFYVNRGKKTIPIYLTLHCGTNGIENIKNHALTILSSHMQPIVEHRPSPFAEYLFKLIEEKGKTEVDVYGAAEIERKVFSDLHKGNTNVLNKRNLIAVIFALQLSADEAYELLAKAGYTRTKYKTTVYKNENIKFDRICICFIDQQNFDKEQFDDELRNNFLEVIFYKNI